MSTTTKVRLDPHRVGAFIAHCAGQFNGDIENPHQPISNLMSWHKMPTGESPKALLELGWVEQISKDKGYKGRQHIYNWLGPKYPSAEAATAFIEKIEEIRDRSRKQDDPESNVNSTGTTSEEDYRRERIIKEIVARVIDGLKDEYGVKLDQIDQTVRLLGESLGCIKPAK